MSVDFKIIPLQFVHNHTFSTIYILLQHLDMQNWEYNNQITGGAKQCEAKRNIVLHHRLIDWLCYEEQDQIEVV